MKQISIGVDDRSLRPRPPLFKNQVGWETIFHFDHIELGQPPGVKGNQFDVALGCRMGIRLFLNKKKLTESLMNTGFSENIARLEG